MGSLPGKLRELVEGSDEGDEITIEHLIDLAEEMAINTDFKGAALYYKKAAMKARASGQEKRAEQYVAKSKKYLSKDDGGPKGFSAHGEDLDDEFEAILSESGELTEASRRGFYIVRKEDGKSVVGPFTTTEMADKKLKKMLADEGISMTDWRNHPYQVIGAGYLDIKRSVGDWTKRPAAAEDDDDDGDYELAEGKNISREDADKAFDLLAKAVKKPKTGALHLPIKGDKYRQLKDVNEFMYMYTDQTKYGDKYMMKHRKTRNYIQIDADSGKVSIIGGHVSFDEDFDDDDELSEGSKVRQELVDRAVKFLKNPKRKPGTVAMLLQFLKKKGLNDDEIMAALDAASGGAISGFNYEDDDDDFDDELTEATLTKDQAIEIKGEMVQTGGIPVRFLVGGQAINIVTGEAASKGSNIMYQPVYWNFTKATSKKIAKWLGAKAVFFK